jgi:hypothetical protein
MPLGWERINNKKSTPNKNIVFIKPCPGPDEAISKDYLERIAAQCLPIMIKNYLAVASLEEYEPNLEFWGMPLRTGRDFIAKTSQDGISTMARSSSWSLSPLPPDYGSPSNSFRWL